MIAYASVGSNNLDEAKMFYDALLASIGMASYYDARTGGRLYGDPSTGFFAVHRPYDGQPATGGNGAMAGFRLDDEEQVRRFHALALSLGATNEGDPGPRGTREPAAFFAYLRDLDGNKICAYCFPGQ